MPSAQAGLGANRLRGMRTLDPLVQCADHDGSATAPPAEKRGRNNRPLSDMDLTCPYCRHVVEVADPAAKTPPRCGNCGAVILPLEGVTPRASPARVSASPALPNSSSADGLAVAALILGMLFFVPVVTQVLAIILGIIALLGRPGDRPGRGQSRTAWAGLLLGCVFLAGWGCVLVLVVSSMRSGLAVPPGGAVRVGYGRAYRPVAAVGEAAMEESIAAQACLEALFSAARAYHLDYRAWPENVDVLTPIYLSNEMGDTARRQSIAVQEPLITMVADVDPAHDPPDRIIAYSAQVRHDLIGELLARPHRWVLRLNGRVTLVPAGEVDAPPDRPDDPSSESSDPTAGQSQAAP